MIDAIGRYVLAEVLNQLATWRLPHLFVAVNVSASELSTASYVAAVLTQLATFGIPAENLRIEVTESQVMENPASAAATLSELDAAGVDIHIDDFGTGFASLLYVRDLPASNLKIDRSFVAGLPDDPRDVAVVATAIKLAHELGLTATGEGVETADQLSCLEELGCDFVQGYLLGRPVPAADSSARRDPSRTATP